MLHYAKVVDTRRMIILLTVFYENNLLLVSITAGIGLEGWLLPDRSLASAILPLEIFSIGIFIRIQKTQIAFIEFFQDESSRFSTQLAILDKGPGPRVSNLLYIRSSTCMVFTFLGLNRINSVAKA